MSQQHQASDLYDLGWKKGNRIFIDGQLYPSSQLKNLTGTFLFQKEEDNTAVQRNLYYTTYCVQQKLL